MIIPRMFPWLNLAWLATNRALALPGVGGGTWALTAAQTSSELMLGLELVLGVKPRCIQRGFISFSHRDCKDRMAPWAQEPAGLEFSSFSCLSTPQSSCNSECSQAPPQTPAKLWACFLENSIIQKHNLNQVGWTSPTAGTGQAGGGCKSRAGTCIPAASSTAGCYPAAQQ